MDGAAENAPSHGRLPIVLPGPLRAANGGHLVLERPLFDVVIPHMTALGALIPNVYFAHGLSFVTMHIRNAS